jgi:hypothetical protein
MGESRVIAEIRGYDEFTAALRAWIGELDTNYECMASWPGCRTGIWPK